MCSTCASYRPKRPPAEAGHVDVLVQRVFFGILELDGRSTGRHGGLDGRGVEVVGGQPAHGALHVVAHGRAVGRVLGRGLAGPHHLAAAQAEAQVGPALPQRPKIARRVVPPEHIDARHAGWDHLVGGRPGRAVGVDERARIGIRQHHMDPRLAFEQTIFIERRAIPFLCAGDFLGGLGGRVAVGLEGRGPHRPRAGAARIEVGHEQDAAHQRLLAVLGCRRRVGLPPVHGAVGVG